MVQESGLPPSRPAYKSEQLPAPRRDHGLWDRGNSVAGPSQQRRFCRDVAWSVDCPPSLQSPTWAPHWPNPSIARGQGSPLRWFTPISLLGREQGGDRRRMDLGGQTYVTGQDMVQLPLILPLSTYFLNICDVPANVQA